jgi:N utilization substance protein B
MNARRAARELALLTLFQLEKQYNGNVPGEIIEKESLRSMILSSIRVLVQEAQSSVEAAATDLASVSHYMIDLQEDHPDNLARPLEVVSQPVPIPTTLEMINRIETCLTSAEQLAEAFRLPELLYHSQLADVQNYAIKLITLVNSHKSVLDALLNEHLDDWRMDRLISIDSCILRVAAAEMQYVSSVDCSVSINEAVDLAKQFSSEESYRLVNGVLGSLAEALGFSRTPKNSLKS